MKCRTNTEREPGGALDRRKKAQPGGRGGRTQKAINSNYIRRSFDLKKKIRRRQSLGEGELIKGKRS